MNWFGPFPTCPDSECTPLEWDIFLPSGLIPLPVKRYNARLQRKGGRFIKLGACPVTKREAMRLALRRQYRGF
jgi:hypothetical protein